MMWILSLARTIMTHESSEADSERSRKLKSFIGATICSLNESDGNVEFAVVARRVKGHIVQSSPALTPSTG